VYWTRSSRTQFGASINVWRLWTLLVTFCIVIIRGIGTFWSPCILSFGQGTYPFRQQFVYEWQDLTLHFNRMCSCLWYGLADCMLCLSINFSMRVYEQVRLGSSVSIGAGWPRGIKVHGFKPSRNRRIFLSKKFLSMPSLEEEVKPSVPRGISKTLTIPLEVTL
jgi:hypothetical protein